MGTPDKLPLVKAALTGLAGELSKRDRVAIVVYAGAAGLVLEPTNDTKKIREAVDRLEAGGATAGGAGLQLAYVKLRYKLPDGATSKLVERAVPASAIPAAALPRGDMAFATAVAAFGQKLRGDPLLGAFSYNQITALAGHQSNFWRQEFLRLVGVAEGLARE